MIDEPTYQNKNGQVSHIHTYNLRIYSLEKIKYLGVMPYLQVLGFSKITVKGGLFPKKTGFKHGISKKQSCDCRGTHITSTRG